MKLLPNNKKGEPLMVARSTVQLNKNNMKRIVLSYKIMIAVGILLIAGLPAKAQFEPQFTQYMFNEMSINPAYAGSREQISATMVYRNQWVGLEGAPKTQSASVHGPLMNKKIGLGLSIMNESIGVTKEFSVYANYAYRLQFRASNLAFGLQGGFVSHQENLSEVITNEENDPEFLYNTPKVFVPNAGFGVYYNSDRFFAGLSIPRMFENIVAADGTGDVTNKFNFETWHYYLTSGYVFPISDEIKLKPTVMIKAVSGAPIVGDFSLNALFKERIWVGASYRSGDSFAGMFQIQLTPQFRLGYSYDYTVTELSAYSNGTHEINLGYDFSFNKKKVVTPRYF